MGCLCAGLSLCASPSDALHLLSPICISHLGPVPLGKFPTPVHLSSQSWTSCFCQPLRGPAGTRTACPSASPTSTFTFQQTGVGTLPHGATSSTGTWSIFVTMSCVLPHMWTRVWQQLAFIWKQWEEKEKLHSHPKVLFSGFFWPCFTVSVWGVF